MAKFTLYPCVNGIILYNNETQHIVEIFPKNECGFTNRSWDYYLRRNRDLDWELSYNMAGTTIGESLVPKDFADFLARRGDELALRRLREIQRTDPRYGVTF